MAEPFLPSRHGFAFDNKWPAQPAVVLKTLFGEIRVGNAADGLCGGMTFAALDYWSAGAAPPSERPGTDHPLYHYIVRRLIQSWHIPAGVAQYYQWMNLPDGDATFRLLGKKMLTERGVSWRTVRIQWPAVKRDLDRGVPVPIGVVTVRSAKPADLGLNHQVLAYAYRLEANRVTVQVYDPNRGRRDDIFIAFGTAAPAEPTAFDHNLGLGQRRVRGFFRAAYSPEETPH